MYFSSIQGSPHFQHILLTLDIFFMPNYCSNCDFPLMLYFLCMSHMVSQYLTLHIQYRINCYCLFSEVTSAMHTYSFRAVGLPYTPTFVPEDCVSLSLQFHVYLGQCLRE